MKTTKDQKKEFALSRIAPYFNNPETCGFKGGNTFCSYLTDDGRMCVAGACMISPSKSDIRNIRQILIESGQKVFKKEYRDILDLQEWDYLQSIHDRIAKNNPPQVYIDALNLFTYEELVEYANKLKNENKA